MEFKSFYLRYKKVLILLFQKINIHSGLFEYYLLKTLAWCFFLLGFFNLFKPLVSDKSKSSISLIEVLFNIKKWKGFQFYVADSEMREVIYFSFIISCFIPIITGSILLLKNKPK